MLYEVITLGTVLYNLLEGTRLIALLVAPFMPDTGTALFGALVFAMIPGADRQSLVVNASAFEMATVVTAFSYNFV